MQDWNYLHSNCFELTIELGCKKYPVDNELKPYWTANEVALLVFMGQVSSCFHCSVRCILITSNRIPNMYWQSSEPCCQGGAMFNYLQRFIGLILV